jgi:hypothetical protein
MKNDFMPWQEERSFYTEEKRKAAIQGNLAY